MQPPTPHPPKKKQGGGGGTPLPRDTAPTKQPPTATPRPTKRGRKYFTYEDVPQLVQTAALATTATAASRTMALNMLVGWDKMCVGGRQKIQVSLQRCPRVYYLRFGLSILPARRPLKGQSANCQPILGLNLDDSTMAHRLPRILTGVMDVVANQRHVAI